MARERESSRKSPRRRSNSPVKDRVSTPSRRRSSTDRERSPAPRNGLPSRQEARSPAREKVRDLPAKRERSRSPSPRTKRLRRARAEQEEMERQADKEDRDRGKRRERENGKAEAENLAERDQRRHSSRGGGRRREQGDGRGEAERDDRRNSSREDRDTRRHREHDDRRDSAKDRRRADQDDRRDVTKDRRSDMERHDRHARSNSVEQHGHRGRRGSRSPRRAPRDGDRDEDARHGADLVPRDQDSVAQMNAAAEALEVKDKQKPSFELSGKLAEETNKVKGVALLHTEPPEARKPDVRWRLYIFKAGEVLNEPLYIHRTSCYLFGRERRVADVPTDHPSCSKQHAVLQFRLVEKEQPDGMMAKQVRPYIMDLGSTNGTYLNDNPIEPQRYYELFEKDTLKFGNSSREYVLLHENSAG